MESTLMIAVVIAYLLVISIYPVVAEFGARGNFPRGDVPPNEIASLFVLWLAVAQTAVLSGFHFVLAGRQRVLRSSLQQILAPQRRWPFAWLVGLGTVAALSSVLSFQGTDESKNSASGASALANMVDVIATLLLGGAVTKLFEGRALKLSLPRVIWTLLALSCAVGFMTLSNRIKFDLLLLWRPEVGWALVWAASGVAIMQLTRSRFSRDPSIDMNGFLAWRYLVPALILGALLTSRAPNIRDVPWTTMLAISCAIVVAVRLQYRCLASEKGTVFDLSTAMLLVPPLTYVVSAGVGLATPALAALLLMLATFLCLMIAVARGDAKILDLRSFLRDLALFYAKLRGDPTVEKMEEILRYVAIAIATTAMLYLPVLTHFDAETVRADEQALPPVAAAKASGPSAASEASKSEPPAPRFVWYLSLFLGTCVILTFASLTDVFDRLERKEQIAAEQRARDVRDRKVADERIKLLTKVRERSRYDVHMIKNLIAKATSPDCKNQIDVLEFSYERLDLFLIIDEDVPGDCFRFVRQPVKPWLKRCIETLRDLCDLREATLTLDVDELPDSLEGSIDGNRLLQAFFELIDNSQNAWNNQNGGDFSGLAMTVRAVAQDEQIQFVYTDTGPGIAESFTFEKDAGIGIRSILYTLRGHGYSRHDIDIKRGNGGGVVVSFSIPACVG